MKTILFTCFIFASTAMIFVDANDEEDMEKYKPCFDKYNFKSMDEAFEDMISNVEQLKEANDCFATCAMEQSGAMKPAEFDIDAEIICKDMETDEKILDKTAACDAAKSCSEKMGEKNARCPYALTYVACIMDKLKPSEKK